MAQNIIIVNGNFEINFKQQRNPNAVAACFLLTMIHCGRVLEWVGCLGVQNWYDLADLNDWRLLLPPEDEECAAEESADLMLCIERDSVIGG